MARRRRCADNFLSLGALLSTRVQAKHSLNTPSPIKGEGFKTGFYALKGEALYRVLYITGERNDNRNAAFNHCYPHVAWRNSHMAPQSKLGVWTQWSARNRINRSDRIVAHGAHISTCAKALVQKPSSGVA